MAAKSSMFKSVFLLASLTLVAVGLLAGKQLAGESQDKRSQAASDRIGGGGGGNTSHILSFVTQSSNPTLNTGDLMAMRSDSKMIEFYWVNGQAYTRSVPFSMASSGVITVNWNGGSAWAAPAGAGTLPGAASDGPVQAQTLAVNPGGTSVRQGIWRNNKGYSRDIPIANNQPDWGHAGAWSVPVDLSAAGLPGGTATLQAQTLATWETQGGKRAAQLIVQNNQIHERSAPIENNQIKWDAGTGWKNVTQDTNLPASGQITGISLTAVVQPDGSSLQLVQMIWIDNKGYERQILHNSPREYVNYDLADAWKPIVFAN